MSTLPDALVCAAVDRARRHDLADHVIADYVVEELEGDEPTNGPSLDAVRTRLAELSKRGLVQG
jgi:hypothetical protein